MESGLYSRRSERYFAFPETNESRSQMTMGASVVRNISAISGAISFTGVWTSTVLSTEERTSRINEDVEVSFVKKSMEDMIFRG